MSESDAPPLADVASQLPTLPDELLNGDVTDASISAIEEAYQGKLPPESVKMLLAIVKGSKMGPGEGWFGPGQSRFHWHWLARRHGIDPADGIPAEKFQGPAEWFERLDRDQDGLITEQDLDWSGENGWIQQSYLVNRIFRRIETQGSGRLTRAEWQAFFENAAAGRDYIEFEDLRDALIGRDPTHLTKGDMPARATLIRGLFSGELGSLHEGPVLDAHAPDFTLQTPEGQQTLRLADAIGTRPVVLVFGNFTCPPFRSMVPGVEAVQRRFANAANFIGIYVREAHPVDGWKMESNNRVGIVVTQPQTDADRAQVAARCQVLLQPSFPLVVDQIHDPVGHAYSAMPARLYVIDTQGKIAYKSGRGPFGFKAGEMEQALIMTLLDRIPSETDPDKLPVIPPPPVNCALA